VPAAQAVQVVSLLAAHAPAAPLGVQKPAAQTVHVVHVAKFAAAEKFAPATQGAQTRLAVAEPATAT